MKFLNGIYLNGIYRTMLKGMHKGAFKSLVHDICMYSIILFLSLITMWQLYTLNPYIRGI
jgi:hypothetical protein